MAHTRADAPARQDSLNELRAAVNELERLITEAEARDQRMASVESERTQDMISRFPALGNRR